MKAHYHISTIKDRIKRISFEEIQNSDYPWQEMALYVANPDALDIVIGPCHILSLHSMGGEVESPHGPFTIDETDTIFRGV